MENDIFVPTIIYIVILLIESAVYLHHFHETFSISVLHLPEYSAHLTKRSPRIFLIFPIGWENKDGHSLFQIPDS